MEKEVDGLMMMLFSNNHMGLEEQYTESEAFNIFLHNY